MLGLLVLAPAILACRGSADAVAADVEHTIVLHRKAGMKLGFSFNMKGRVPYITHISTTGLLALWNTEHPGEAVKAGEEIIGVNGMQGSAQVFLAAFRSSKRLEIKLWRRAYEVDLDKSGGLQLGLSLSRDYGSLVISDISAGGLVGRWNAAHPGAQVQLGDEILEVNKVHGDVDAMYGECAKNKLLRLTLWRRRLLEPEAPGGGAFFYKPATRVFEQTYWPRFSKLFLEEGTDAKYPMPPRHKVPDLLGCLKDVRGLAVHTEPGTTVTEGQGYAMFAAGMRKDLSSLLGLTVAWQAAGQGFSDGPACGGCGAKCGGSEYGNCLCKTVEGAYMPGWEMPMNKDYKMGSATDADQDAITGLIYLAELTNSEEIRRYAVRSITAFVLEDLGHSDAEANSRPVPVEGEIPPKHQRIYLWRTGTCGGGFDQSSNDPNHDLCISPGYFAPGQWRLFQRYLREHAHLVPEPHTAEKLGEVLESSIVWGYNMVRKISCDNGLVSNWWSLPKSGWPHEGKLQCSNSGTEAGAYYSDAARIPWRVVLDYLWFPEAKTPAYDGFGRLLGHWGAKEYANRWSSAWMKLIQANSGASRDRILGLLRDMDTCRTVPKGFTAPAKNGWGSLPVVTTFQVPNEELKAEKSQEWLSYVANISLDESVSYQYFDLGQEVIISTMVGGGAWMPLSRAEFVVTLDKSSGKELGLDLDQLGPVLTITAVRNGVVRAWNDEHPYWAVKAGDAIVDVNSVGGNVSRQLAEIRRGEHLMIKLLRAGNGLYDSHPPRASVSEILAPAPVAPTTTTRTTSTATSTTSTDAEMKRLYHMTTSTTTTTKFPPTTKAPEILVHGKACSPLNSQCGGDQWTGPTCCETGCHCKAQGSYYSQCVPPAGKTFCNETAEVVMDEVRPAGEELVGQRPSQLWGLGWLGLLLASSGLMAGVAGGLVGCRRAGRAVSLRHPNHSGYLLTGEVSPRDAVRQAQV